MKHHAKAKAVKAAALKAVVRAHLKVKSVSHHLKHWRSVLKTAVEKRDHAKGRCAIWHTKVKVAIAHLKAMKTAEAKAIKARKAANSHERVAARKKSATYKKWALSKVAKKVAVNKEKASKAKALKANKDVHAHMKKGIKEGHM